MTLCIAWHEGPDIKFVSDLRVSFGSVGTSDFGIKVVRIPFNIYGPDAVGEKAPSISSGDLGMAFAGLTVGPLMIKEALAEILLRMQAVPGFHDYGMDGIADYVFRAYKTISEDICQTIGQNGRTCVVFGGYCTTRLKLRAFRIEIDPNLQARKSEVLVTSGDIEIFGSGEIAARALLPVAANEREIVKNISSLEWPI